MRYRSPKRQKIYEQRRALVEKLLAERPRCEACGPKRGYEIYITKDNSLTFVEYRATDVHEIRRRSQGGSILDERNLLAVCRNCHNWINNNPVVATVLGLSLPSWADDAMYDEAATLRARWREGHPSKPSWGGLHEV